MKFERIRNLREDKDITQTQMTEYLYIKQTTYSKYERGTINIPVDTLIRLADYFDVSLDYLVGRTNEREWKRKK